MEWQFTPYMFIFLAAAAAAALFALVGWRRRLGVKSFVFLPLLTMAWALVYTVEIGCRSVECAGLWVKMRFSIGAVLALVWLVFALEYARRMHWLTRRNLALLLVIPVVTLAAIWTSHAHELVYYDTGIEVSGGVCRFTFSPGPLYGMHINFIYLVYIIAVFLIFLTLAQMPHLYRQHAGVILFASLVPALANLTFLAELLPVSPLNWTPVALAVRDGIILWSLLRHELVDVIPVARSLAIENMHDAILVVDVNDRIVDANTAAQELLDKKVIGRSILQIFSDQKQFLSYYARDEKELCVEISNSAGSFLEVYLSTLRDSEGARIGRLLVLHDITDQRTTERQLRTLSQAIEQSPSTIVITDTEGNIEYANPKFTEVTGYTIAEALGQNPRILKSGQMPPEVYQELWAAISHGEEWRGEFLNRKKNGELYWEHAVIAPVRSAEGETIRYVAVKDDITARKKTEEALREANERLELLRSVDAELSSKLVVSYVLNIALDAAMRLTLADASYIALKEGDGMRVARILGDYPPELVGALLPEEGLAAHAATARRAKLISNVTDYDAIRPSTQAQILCPLASGEQLIGVLSVESSRADAFTPDVFEFAVLLAVRVAVAIDNAQMYEEREQLVQELEAFARTVAHDLKNPVGALIGYTEMLDALGDSLSEEKKSRYIAQLGKLARKLDTIIEALLTLSGVRRVDDVEMTPLDMAHILAEVQERLDRMVAEYDAKVTFNAPQAWPSALGYVPWVEEIWMNYLSNAIKYGGTLEAPPQIELGAERINGGEHVRFWVRDHGPGISPEQQEQLFTEFTRLGDLAVEGHGLGLSIVKRIVEKLGGEVAVESAPGEGSTFSFILPAV